MTSEEQIGLLTSAINATTLVRDSLANVPPSDVIHVMAGESIQAAIDDAPDGATVVLEPATYDEALEINKPLQLVPATRLRHGRASADAAVWITSDAYATLTVTGAGVVAAGIGIRNRTPSGDAVDLLGSRILFDRCTVLGDPTTGMRRGWLTHGSYLKITGCHCDDVFNVGRDTCCVGGFDGGDNILVDDCYLCGGAEGIMFGGGDSTAPDRLPKHITVTHSTLTKKRDWYARGDIQLKNGFELKAAQHVYVADCLIEGGGVSEGQSGYICVLTVRNQDGAATWSEITDVLFERCHFRYGGAGILFLGKDSNYESGPLRDVAFRNCKVSEIDPYGFTSTAQYKGSGRVACFLDAEQNVTLDGLTTEGIGLAALGYFSNTPKQPHGLVMRNWNYSQSPTTYGWKIDDGGLDVPPACTNLKALMPDLVYEITDHDPGATGYPSGDGVGMDE